MMTYTERARALRPYIVKASASLTDADALKAMELYRRWEPGLAVKAGDRLVYSVNGTDRLFRVNEGQAHTTQEGWEPDKTPAMFTVIDEEHAPVARLGHGFAHGVESREALQEAAHVIGVVFSDLCITEFGSKQGGKPPIKLGPAFAGRHEFLHFSSVDDNREP